MIRQPPVSTRTDTPLPDTTLCRSHRRVAQHDAALVERRKRAHAFGLQLRGRRRRARSARLLVVPRNQIDTAFRLETPFRQRLDRLEQTDQRSLVVDGAASPYRLFGEDRKSVV